MQIKVKETRIYNTSSRSEPGTKSSTWYDAQKTVAEAKLVLVRDTNVLLTSKHATLIDNIYIKPILISETEKIEVGELVYDSYAKIILSPDKVFIGSNKSDYYQKILALPEHFSPQLLQDIVDSKLKDGDKVLVECELEKANFMLGEGEFIIKLNSSNHITLYKVEEKMYTREEILSMFNKIPSNTDGKKLTWTDIKSWFEKNLK